MDVARSRTRNTGAMRSRIPSARVVSSGQMRICMSQRRGMMLVVIVVRWEEGFFTRRDDPRVNTHGDKID